MLSKLKYLKSMYVNNLKQTEIFASLREKKARLAELLLVFGLNPPKTMSFNEK